MNDGMSVPLPNSRYVGTSLGQGSHYSSSLLNPRSLLNKRNNPMNHSTLSRSSSVRDGNGSGSTKVADSAYGTTRSSDEESETDSKKPAKKAAKAGKMGNYIVYFEV